MKVEVTIMLLEIALPRVAYSYPFFNNLLLAQSIKSPLAVQQLQYCSVFIARIK